MNLYNLSDKTRIKFLKLALLAVSASALSLGVAASLSIKAMEESRDKNLKLAKLSNRVVKRFIELAPEEISQQITEEFKFDVVTLDLDL